MRTSFRRPSPPQTPEFWERLESELRRKMSTNPARRPPRRHTLRFLKLARSLARPAFHGAMILISIVIVASTVETPDPVHEAVAEEVRLSHWVPVAQVEDPAPSLVVHAINDETARFVTFIVTPAADDTPVPMGTVAI